MFFRLFSPHHRNSWLGIAILCCLAGCASAPEVHYYTLDMGASGKIHDGPAIEIGIFRPSDALSRPELMIHTSPTEIEYYQADQWAANLADLVEEKLAVELESSAWSAEAVRLDGDILAFEQIDTPGGADAHIKLEIRVRETNTSRTSQPLLRKIYEERIPARTNKPGAVVIALSRALEEIAVQISVDIGTL